MPNNIISFILITIINGSVILGPVENYLRRIVMPPHWRLSKRPAGVAWGLHPLLPLLLLLLSGAAQPAKANLRDRLGQPVRYVYNKMRDIGQRNIDRFRNRIDRGAVSPIGRLARATDNYQAMCVFSRGPSLKKSPNLFFFTNEINAQGCQAKVELELNSIDNEYRQLDDQFARASINRKLLEGDHYKPTRPTYVLIHGFLSDWTGNWLCATKDLILNKTQANVFILDWSGGSKPMVPLDYGSSVSNIQYVADLLSRFLELLIDMSRQHNASRFHLIGHSLGAHISGFVGYALKGAVGQITGLDPAGPCFTTRSEAESAQAEATGEMRRHKRRLSPESAKFVLALHTDASLFGLDENCAHYDVYVNGGTRQPKCPATNPLSRFGDLLHMNLGAALNLDVVCCHSYAHQMLDSCVDFTSWGQEQQQQQLQQQVAATHAREEQKCFPMAYKCPDWVSFQAGECGFCRDNDSHCVYTGISLYDYQVRKLAEDNLEYQWSSKVVGAVDEDLDFNDEDNDQAGSSETATSDPDEEATKRRYAVEAGQHFMRSGADHPTCLFQYQILIAVESDASTAAGGAASANKGERPYFYLHLPLDRSGQFQNGSGKKLPDRLVQVSHRIEPQSPVYRNLRSNYMSALSERLGQPLEGTHLKLDFYSALITFKQATGANCAPGGSLPPGGSGGWQLCEPLADIRTARLWSSGVGQLQKVQWVALNFMSGLTYEQRMQNSYALLRPPLEVAIKSRDEIDQKDQVRLARLSPRAARSILTSTKCLVGVFDLADLTNSRHDWRCKRSSAELKYAVELEPRKLHA